MRRTNAALAVLAVPLAVFAVAGCGKKKEKTAAPPPSTTPASTQPAGGGQKLEADADPGGAIKFTTTKLDAKAGQVTLTLKNPSSSGVQHGIAVDGNGVDKDGPVVQPGGTSTVSVKLKPGKYHFYCPFDQHRKLGMEGSLTVK